MRKLNLAHYSMGFLQLMKPGQVQLRGSGTLVKLGKTHGILTAAHVWQAVSHLKRVGIYLYPPRRTEIHAITEEVGLLDAVTFQNSEGDDLGPDLAFVRLREDKVSSIEKHSAFLNLERDEQKALAGPPGDSAAVDIVVGGVEALGQTINIRDDQMLIVQNSLANVGHSRSLEDGRLGFDRLEFTPDPGGDFVLPQSYGGMSGGGCFRLYFPQNSDAETPPTVFHLIGVAFYETLLNGKADKIICHGRRSMTEKLLPVVRAKWS